MMQLPAVGGRRVMRSYNELERAALVCLANEQEKINADSGLIAVLCDTVRLIREVCDKADDDMAALVKLTQTPPAPPATE